MVKVPHQIPADPAPATARPRINITEEGALAQIVDPTSKKKRADI